MYYLRRCSAFVFFYILVMMLSGCVVNSTEIKTKDEVKTKEIEEKEIVYVKPVEQMTVESFEAAGKWWGIHVKNTPDNPLNEELINALMDSDNLAYFTVHRELKYAFQKGFRFGYKNRVADLVLGPNISEAAGRIGKKTSQDFVDVINAFEDGWVRTLHKAVSTFITLISEGSQADREKFINEFVRIYQKKWERTRAIIKAGTTQPMESGSGTVLHINMSKTIGVLDIPSPDSLKTEIYIQAFHVMGYEMGDRYTHDLIRRDELIEWLRRSKTALNMDHPTMDRKKIYKNLDIIRREFVPAYGPDGNEVFNGIAKEAGY